MPGPPLSRNRTQRVLPDFQSTTCTPLLHRASEQLAARVAPIVRHGTLAWPHPTQRSPDRYLALEQRAWFGARSAASDRRLQASIDSAKVALLVLRFASRSQASQDFVGL